MWWLVLETVFQAPLAAFAETVLAPLVPVAVLAFGVILVAVGLATTARLFKWGFQEEYQGQRVNVLHLD